MISGLRTWPSAASGSLGAGAQSTLGAMPEWDLSDLYPGPKSAEVVADLETAAARAKSLKTRYQGSIAALGRDGEALAQAVAD